MAATRPGQSLVSFAEVALYFSSEEWALLSPCQRGLYDTVMMENYDNVIFVASVWNHIEQNQSSKMQRLFTCQESRKSFSTRNGLILHQKTHTRKKPLKCQECGMTFSRRSHLKIHRRSNIGEKPFKCQECGKAFNENGTLKVHQRTHTGEKPYKCQECGITFSHSGSFISHQRTYSEEQPDTL